MARCRCWFGAKNARTRENPKSEYRKRLRGPKQIQMTKRESTKFEARSTKQIQNDEKQNNDNAPNRTDEFTGLDFLILNLFWPRFVSNFVLRISDLVRRPIGAVNSSKSLCLTFST